MPDFIVSLGGLDDFLVYFILSLALTALFLAIYVRVTPYREFAMIRAGNVAAAASLSGALLGFVMPLASAIAHSVALWDMVLWGIIAMAAQLLAYGAVRLLVPTIAADITAGKLAPAILLAAFSLGAGILNAASMTY